MTLTAEIRQRIARTPKGMPFSSKEFLGLGSRAAVDQALARMVKAGLVTRVRRGVFVVPRHNAHVGMVPPTPEKVIQAIGKTTGETLAPHGAEAARRLGLSTQVPMTPVFYTSGLSRSLRLGTLEVVLKHVSQRKLAMAEKPAGQALSALWYLGKQNVTPETFAAIKQHLSPGAFSQLKNARAIMPGWMANCLARYEKESAAA